MRGDIRGVQKVADFPAVRPNNYLLIVYATWCGACHAFGEQLNTSIVQYGAGGDKKHLGHALAAEMDVLAVEYVDSVQRKVSIQFYPTVLAMSGDGKVLERFEGPRSPGNLVAFARKHRGSRSSSSSSKRRETMYRLVSVDARDNSSRTVAQGACAPVREALAEEVQRIIRYVEGLRNEKNGDVRVSVRFRAKNQTKVWETITHAKRDASDLKAQEENARELAELFRHCHRNNFEVRIERTRRNACCEPPDVTWGRVNGHCCAYTKTYKMQVRQRR